MALDLKILACVALFVVMVQGRAGDPGNVRRQLLLEALSNLRESRNYAAAQYEREGETATPDDNSPETNTNEMDVVTDNTDEEFVEQVFEDIKTIIGPPCADDFEAAVQEYAQEEDQGEATDARYYQVRSPDVSDLSSVLSALQSGIDAAQTCLANSGNDGTRNLPYENDDGDTEDTVVVDDEGTTTQTPETTTDTPDETTETLDEKELTELVEKEVLKELLGNEYNGEGEDESDTDDVKATTVTTEIPETTTDAPDETTETVEEKELTERVEKEILKDLLRKRIHELSKEGYNGKK